jgi:predicted HAD superfamily hydrolase
MEEDVEAASLGPRPEAVDLYGKALVTQKPVVLISDMFLPRDLIEKSLKKHGIQNWDALFLSNEIGLRKDNGSLYKHVLAHYAIEPAEMLMIGDNERSDIQIPCDMGIPFLHLFTPAEFARGLPRFTNIIIEHERSGDVNAEITLGLVVRKNFTPIIYQSFDPDSLVEATPYNWGYSLVGPLLISFTEWLYRKACEDGTDRLHFLSREGKIIKQVYDCWTEGIEKAPESDYLVVSRRAAGVAAISTLEDILDIAKKDYFPNTIEKFLITRFGLNLTNQQWEEYASPFGFERTTTLRVKNRQISHLLQLLQSLEPIIFATAQSERKTLIRYLIDKGLDRDDHQAVVDIGYGGSVQGYMNQLLSKKVHGYYIMTDERSEKVATTHGVIIRSSFLGRTMQPPETSLLYELSFKLEKLLSTNEPQIEFYIEDSTGKIEGHYRDLLSQEIECANLKDQLQEGALDYARDARQIREMIFPNFQPSCWTAQMIMEAFLIQLSKREMDLLSKIILDDYYNGRDLVA